MKLKIKFVDFEAPQDRVAQFCPVFPILQRHFDVVFADDPDYLFSGGIGMEYASGRYDDAIRIAVIGENYVPDYNFFDYSIGSEFMDFGDRHLRYPLFSWYSQFRELPKRDLNRPTDEQLLNRGFCSFVVSNTARDPFCFKFFERLNQYKPIIASGGRCLNNVGGAVTDKVSFLRDYKFNVAFENSASPGYTTEKIMEPLLAHTLPIYYGNPRIEDDFRADCMIRVRSPDDLERAIEEIISLDNDDAAYLERVKGPCAIHDSEWFDTRLEKFLLQIVNASKSEAKRTMGYGRQAIYRRDVGRVSCFTEGLRPLVHGFKRLMK